MKLFRLIHITLSTASFSAFLVSANAQDSAKLTFSGYCELYYSYDFSNPANHERPFFLYNHKRHNEVNLNLGLARLNYSSGRIRSNLGLMAGTYSQYNLAHEPVMLRHVYEANVGVRLSKTRNLWLDVGIMPSHIGFESAIGADCFTASRSMQAENSPYYESGVKLTTTSQKENFSASILLLNGWQRIERPEGINRPSFGMQVHYKPSDRLTLNYSNFIGSDKPDSLKSLRTYHNLYGIWSGRITSIILSLDVGTERMKNASVAVWYSPVIILANKLGPKSFLTGRYEFFSDKRQVLLHTGTNDEFETTGISLDYDYIVTDKSKIRMEIKSYFSGSKIFNETESNRNFSILMAICQRF